MQFIETPIFTRAVRAILSDDEYRALQDALMLRPEQGALIKGSGGLRKVRWAAKGAGKRGGARIIYLGQSERGLLYALRLSEDGTR